MQISLNIDKRFWLIGAGLIAILIFSLIWGLVIRTPAYSVYVDGNKKFLVKNKTQFNQIIEKVQTAEEVKLNQNLNLAKKVNLKIVFAKRQDITDPNSVENELRKAFNMKIIATAFVIKGQSVAYVDNPETAQRLLDTIKTQFTAVDPGEKLIEIKYQEDVQLSEEEVLADQVLSEQQAYDLLTTGANQPERYIVQEGDSLWSIARSNDLYVKDIIQANQLTNERLKPGQELLLVKFRPYITIIAQVQGEKDEEIPFDVKVVEDSAANSSIRVKQDGQPGQKHIVYTATRINGVIDKRVVKDEKILKQAVAKILIKGKQVQVASRGSRTVTSTGNLDWPISGSISQYFGNKGHTGLDITAPRGSTIKAADGGYVTFAGYQGNYGNFVIIDHGNGTVSRYAHCDSLSVRAGQSVAKGQAIGTVGMTGRTTGPHLHFEVRSGGSFGNPLKFLK